MKLLARVLLGLAAVGIGWVGIALIVGEAGPCAPETESRVQVLGWVILSAAALGVGLAVLRRLLGAALVVAAGVILILWAFLLAISCLS
ncbi:MAG TPA: hypothetical protein VFZ00_19065 [Solirubrobacter sp.]|nr:hypothetical protein [Solirubrobacter sp.]